MRLLNKMSEPKEYTQDDIVGIEAKHITLVNNRDGREDMHVVKEIVHFKDGNSTPRLRQIVDYQRPIWVTHKGLQNHNDKKDYEFERNTRKYMTTQRNLINTSKKALGIGFTSGWTGLKTLARPTSPENPDANGQFLYGADVSSVCCLKYDYRKAYPDLITLNTVAGGDIETNVYQDDRDGEIICMSVSFKENVYLAYMSRWVSDIDDPVAQTYAGVKDLPELDALIKGRNIKLTVEVLETPFDVVVGCIRKLHEWKPDFFSFWNMNFDMKHILKTIDDAGIDPALVFSDPSIPNSYKYFHYKDDSEGQNISASGVNKSKSMEDQWHWVTAPASFQPVDAMSTYRLTRLAGGKEPSYALDAILKKELYIEESAKVNTLDDLEKILKEIDRVKNNRKGSYANYLVAHPKDDQIRRRTVLSLDDETGEEYEEIVETVEHSYNTVSDLDWGTTVQPGYMVKYIFDYGKLKFPEVDHLTGIDWHREMQLKHKIKYGLYNIVDSIRLEQLDEHINDLSSNITLYSKYSDYKNFNSNPKKLCDDMHFWYQERPDPQVMATSSDQQNSTIDSHVISARGWILTLPSYMMAPSGLKCVHELPDYRSYITTHVSDLDIVSTYPTVSQILNMGRETLVMEFSQIQGVSELYRREFGVNLNSGKVNSVEMCQKVMKGVTFETMLEAYKRNKVA